MSVERNIAKLKLELDMLTVALYLNRKAPLHRLVIASRKGCTGQ